MGGAVRGVFRHGPAAGGSHVVQVAGLAGAHLHREHRRGQRAARLPHRRRLSRQQSLLRPARSVHDLHVSRFVQRVFANQLGID